MKAPLIEIELAQPDGRRRDHALLDRSDGDERLLGRKIERLALCRARPFYISIDGLSDFLGPHDHDAALAEMLPDGNDRVCDQRQVVGHLIQRQPAIELVDKKRQIPRAPKALGDPFTQSRRQRAWHKSVRERRQLYLSDRLAAPLRADIEGPQAVDGVAEKLDAHRRLAIRRKDIKNAAATRRLSRRRDGILDAISSVVESLEQHLRRHLFAHVK
jgi:hypothetical protein